MNKVDFLIIGAQKCGTTSLFELLSLHPSISTSAIKEPAFFSNNDWQNKLNEYHSLYQNLNNSVCGEASTMYTFYPENPDTARNIYEYNPQIKLIYLLKNPISRIESHFAHRKVRSREKLSIDEAIKKNRQYVDISKYYMQISRYRQYFPDDQIKIVLFENLINNFRNEMKSLCEFLDIDTQVFESINQLPIKNESLNQLYPSDFGKRIINNSLVNNFPYRFRQTIKWFFSKSIFKKEKLSFDTKEYVFEELIEDISALERYSGLNLNAWKTSLLKSE